MKRDFEDFVHAKIGAGNSFALETTLRSTITFRQAKLAAESGFRVSMFYVALDTVERHIERVMRRAARGGHSASERTLRRVYANSLGNLPMALVPEASGIEIVQIYDNSQSESPPTLVLAARRGQIIRLAENVPAWLQAALGWTEQDVKRGRNVLARYRDTEGDD